MHAEERALAGAADPPESCELDEEGNPSLLTGSADATVPPISMSAGVAFAHIVKGSLGPGALALPYAFAKVGPFVGALLVAAIATQGSRGVVILARLKHDLGTDGALREGVVLSSSLTFAGLGELAFGPFGRVLINTLVLVLQLGICSVYISVVSSNLCAPTSSTVTPWTGCSVRAPVAHHGVWRHPLPTPRTHSDTCACCTHCRSGAACCWLRSAAPCS